MAAPSRLAAVGVAAARAPGLRFAAAVQEIPARVTERHDVEVIQVDFSESHRFAIAGLHCATMELVRDQDPD